MRKTGSRGQYHARNAPLAIKADSFGLFFEAPPAERSFELAMGGAVAVVEVCGPLAQRPGWFWDSYEEIADRVKAALASSAKGVILRIDSPGGDALGCFECAREIRAAALEAKKPLFAFADGTAASAAYALACSATAKVLVPPAGFVGSIGVLQPVVDVTAQDAAYGVKYSLFASGKMKAVGNPHATLTPEGADEIQARVDSLAELFFELVAETRPGVTAAHVKGLEGRMFHGEGAVRAGLADAVVTWTEALGQAAGVQAQTSSAQGAMTMDTEKKAAAMKAIRDAYGDDKDGADKAIKSAFPDEDKDGDKDKDKKDAKAAEDEKEKAKAAKDEEDTKALAARASAGDAKAASELAFKALEENHRLRAEIAAKDEAAERKDLLARRPDFDATIRATLEGLPIAKVREAVEKWPRLAGPRLQPVPSPSPTRGETQVNDPGAITDLDPKVAARIDAAMGLAGKAKAVSTYERGVQTLEFCTPEQARERLEQIKKEGVK